ncbi:MAG TPA: transketolase family protein, partial [Candidatus Omnitrophota bacterium]|nr:transketolase family protein [Candidatus Omnitrophota bacterium]
HTIYGGMGSAVAEVLVQECPVPMRIMGIADKFGVSGSPAELYAHFCLTEDCVVKEAEKLLTRKKK